MVIIANVPNTETDIVLEELGYKLRDSYEEGSPELMMEAVLDVGDYADDRGYDLTVDGCKEIIDKLTGSPHALEVTLGELIEDQVKHVLYTARNGYRTSFTWGEMLTW